MVRFTNKNKRNAYGKCGSATAKTKAKKREAADKSDDPAEAKATGASSDDGPRRPAPSAPLLHQWLEDS